MTDTTSQATMASLAPKQRVKKQIGGKKILRKRTAISKMVKKGTQPTKAISPAAKGQESAKNACKKTGENLIKSPENKEN